MNQDSVAYDFDALGSNWNYEPPRAELLRQVSIPIYTTDPNGWLTDYNDAAAELWGYRPVLGNARWCGAWRLYRDDGTVLPHEDCAMALALREGRAFRGMQTIAERPDGTRVGFIPHPTPLRDQQGAIVAGSNIVLAIGNLAAEVCTRANEP